MNKLAIITGGSRGLGKSMALHLADKGRDIIITYKSSHEAADEVVKAIQAKGRKALALQLSVEKAVQFDTFANTVFHELQETFNRKDFDFLINNAGSGVYAPFGETSEADLNRMISEHIKAPFLLSQALLPYIKDEGRILNVSSGLTRMVLPGYCAYAMMKGAVETMSQYMAVELGKRKIRVNTLAPGAIETDFGGGVVRDNDDINTEIAHSTALGRVGLPDDIGGAVAALLDDGASWINGQRIEASGGQRL